jgi:hypothetical protein
MPPLTMLVLLPKMEKDFFGSMKEIQVAELLEAKQTAMVSFLRKEHIH